MLAASGGPRWIGLVGIDRALARFLAHRRRTLPLLGASSGAWRIAALAADSSLETYAELEHAYIEQRYVGNPSADFVSQTCRDYLSDVFTRERVEHALGQSTFQLNVSTTILPGPSPSRAALMTKLLRAVVLNSLDRRLLNTIVERGLFVSGEIGPDWPLHGDPSWDGVKTRQIPLTAHNFVQALLASGSIPLVLRGEPEIPEAGPGHHFDGGVIDYHFEVENSGPVLYPHFSDDPLPGWLDRYFPHRRITKRARRQLCIIMPSRELIARYPGSCFPGREDFETLSNDERIQRWRQVVEENTKLEKELTACLESGDLLAVSEEF